MPAFFGLGFAVVGLIQVSRDECPSESFRAVCLACTLLAGWGIFYRVVIGAQFSRVPQLVGI